MNDQKTNNSTLETQRDEARAEAQGSLRDKYAMASLTGMWANHKCVEKGTDWMIAHALISADAMLAARNQTKLQDG